MANHKTIQIKGLPHQVEFWNDWTPGAFIAVVGGLGSGKTYGLIIKTLLCHFRYPNINSMLVEPTFRLCLDTLVDTFHKVARTHFPWLKYRFKRGDMVIELPQFNAQILLRSADEPIKLRGPNMGWVGIDEPGQMDQEGFEDAAGRARIGDLQQVFCTGTPEGLNWFSDKFNNPTAPYKTIRAKHRHPDLGKNYEQKLRDIYVGQDAKLRAYLNGEFVQLFTGIVYPSFDMDVNVKECNLDVNEELILACDFNIDPLAWIVIQEQNGITCAFDVISVTGTTEDAALEFLRRYPRGCVKPTTIHIYGDRSGKSGSTRSNESDYEIMIRIFREGGYLVTNHTPDTNPPVIDRVNSINAALGNQNIIIDERAELLIRSFLKTGWEKGKRVISKPSNDKHTHFSDALGYYIHIKRPVTSKRALSIGNNRGFINKIGQPEW